MRVRIERNIKRANKPKQYRWLDFKTNLGLMMEGAEDSFGFSIE